MPITVSPTELRPGWFALRYPFSREVNECLKIVPGVKFDPTLKSWVCGFHALGAVANLLQSSRIGLLAPVRAWAQRSTPALVSPAEKLRDYQLDVVQRSAVAGNYLASMDMRTGKTLVAISWISAHLNAGLRTALVIYPSMATDEWARQWTKFQPSIPFAQLEGIAGLNPEFAIAAASVPSLALGISYELLRIEKGKPSKTVQDLLDLLAVRGEFVCAADELHWVQNRKAPRTQLFQQIGKLAKYRLGLTGTPMRNKPANLFIPLDWLWPGEWGSWSKFSKRYAGGQVGKYGWVADQVTEPEELHARLSSCSARVTRAQAAPWLPKSERKVVPVVLDEIARKLYEQKEAMVAGSLNALLKSDGSAPAGAMKALEDLAAITAPGKFAALTERVKFHASDRGVKMVIGALHHQTLNDAWHHLIATEKTASPEAPPPWLFIAPGWVQRPAREKAILAWKNAKPVLGQPAPVLMVNTLSSGMAIDLSDADVTVCVEACWVPADFLQFEARIHDVHQGKRSSPPIHEYLLARGTVDEDMVMRLLTKLEAMGKVVGIDAEAAGAHEALASSGVTDRGVVGLVSTDDDTILGVIARMRDRALRGGHSLAAPIADTSENRDEVGATDVLDNEDDDTDE